MNKKAELDETVLESGRQFAARMEQGKIQQVQNIIIVGTNTDN